MQDKDSPCTGTEDVGRVQYSLTTPTIVSVEYTRTKLVLACLVEFVKLRVRLRKILP